MVKQVSGNIDYTFLYRHQVGKLLDRLTYANKSYEELDEVIQKLYGLEKYVVPVVLERFKQAGQKEASVLSQVLMLIDDREMGNKLMSMVLDPQIPDKNKNYLLKVLDYYGLEPEMLPYDEVFNDPDNAMAEAKESLYQELNHNVEIIPQFLSELDDFNTESQLNLIRDTVKPKDERVVPLLKVLAQVDKVEIAEEAIQSLGQIEAEKSKEALLELKQNASDFLLPNINRELSRLTMRGIISHESDISTIGSQLDDIYQVAISKLDGRGNRVVWIARRWKGKQQGLAVVNLLLNANEGIKDCWGIYQIRIKDFHGILQDFRRDGSVISHDPQYGMALVRDAIYTDDINESKKPMEFAFWQNFLDPKWMRGESYTPKLDQELYQQVVNEPGLWRELEKLINHDDFHDWFIHHSYIYDLASNILYQPKTSKKDAPVLLSTPNQLDEIYQQVINNLILPKLSFYRRLLTLMGDFQLKKGRTKIYRTILLCLNNMQKGEADELQNNPFIIGMIKRSIQIAARNLRDGHDIRKNPDLF